MESTDPAAAGLARAAASGDVAMLEALLAAYPGLAAEPIRGRHGWTKSPLHLAADWPGFFPNGSQIVAVLAAAGADPDARTCGGPHAETPLHWAAGSDDADVASALIDAGADIEAPGGSAGTPLGCAVAYGCWSSARLLAARGARITTVAHAAALGIPGLLEELLAAGPSPDQVSEAFWHACHAGQRRAAERLARAGADLDCTPGDLPETPAQAAAALGPQRSALIGWLTSLIQPIAGCR
ncbi:MAG: ankyrin repeat domain-containing protein [Streptosporangiaceae bacterium]